MMAIIEAVGFRKLALLGVALAATLAMVGCAGGGGGAMFSSHGVGQAPWLMSADQD